MKPIIFPSLRHTQSWDEVYLMPLTKNDLINFYFKQNQQILKKKSGLVIGFYLSHNDAKNII